MDERDGRFGVSERELRWLRRFGKRVYLYAYGADVRTRKETEALGKMAKEYGAFVSTTIDLNRSQRELRATQRKARADNVRSQKKRRHS